MSQLNYKIGAKSTRNEKKKGAGKQKHFGNSYLTSRNYCGVSGFELTLRM
jgi:hypothetical protein